MEQADESTQLAVPDRRADPAAALAAGSLLCNGTYRLEARLGSGGMGEVWRGVNTVTGSVCAIKTIRAEMIEDRFSRDLFAREAEALKSVRDPAVVGYEGAFRDENGRLLIVMEHVDGPSLGERLRERPLAADEIERLLRRLGHGLDAAHARGVHHRDLSPDNVLLPGGRLDDAVLIDFGIARREGRDGPTLYGGPTPTFAGKLSYASPEQLGAVDAPVDHRSDIYTLGLVLAAAARGRPLPMGGDAGSARAARLAPPDLSGLPKPVQHLLAPLLMTNPAARPASFAALLQPPATPSASPPRRVPWLGIGIGTAVAGTLAAAAWMLFLEPLPPPVEMPAMPLEEAPPVEATMPPVEVTRPPVEPALPPTDVVDPEAVVPAEPERPCPRVDPAALASRRDCVAARRIAELIGSPGLPTPTITLSRADGFYVAGRDVFVADVAVPDASLPLLVYLDYFHENGDVYHLLPEPLTTANRLEAGGSLRVGREAEEAFGSEDRVWRLSEPFGHGQVVAIATAVPLYDGLRPIGEPADDYLAFLAGRLQAVARDGSVASSAVAIETRASP